jgi:heme a synthase
MVEQSFSMSAVLYRCRLDQCFNAVLKVHNQGIATHYSSDRRPATMALIFQSFPLLRHAAPRLSKRFFTCAVHTKKQFSNIDYPIASTIRCRANTPFLQAFRSRTNQRQTRTVSQSVPATTAVESIAATLKQGSTPKQRFFPDASEKSVAYWLIGSAVSVFGIVVFGGLTRLTESG